MRSYKLITIAIVFYLTYTNADQTTCDSENSTVCSFLNGTKTCCPVRDGTCCPDTNYCCPRGFKCETKNSRCVKDDMYIPYYLRTKQLDDNFKVGKDILCPDNTTSCKETQTCCLFGDNDYGCCPLLHAQCCDDKVHCCPKSYKCNPSKGKCDRVDSNGELFSIKWFKKQPGVKKNKVNDDNLCPDEESQCPAGSTCCELESGDWGCCPLPNAICCEDKLHCCPENHTCDVKEGRCNKEGISIPFVKKIEAVKVKETCPGGAAQCPSGTTCCQLSSGDWGCCPIPNAVCCEDHQHCCPSGYTCDVKAGRCNKGELSIPFLQKTEAVKVSLTQTCPGGTAQCPSGTTCCQLSSGDWGCCPIPNAVCCEDHQHCCPSGYTCDVKAGRCNKGALSIPFLPKTEAVKVKQTCPGGGAECPSGTTCCQLSSGDWGCCPIVNAVCCEDHLHCCPSGYTCDVKAGRCNKGELSIPFLQKTEAVKVSVTQICPGGGAECPSGTTCCQLSSGDWGCCPIPNAVCCEDHLHCCPSGYTCDVKAGRCNKHGISIPFLVKTKALPKKEEVKQTCPGGDAECPSGTTCCELGSGDYGCCPLPNAVCCEDHQHCCPSGYICDVKAGRCSKGAESIPFYKKLLANLKRTEKVSIEKESIPSSNIKLDAYSVVCPDGCSFCPNGYTCCKMNDGSYGCCPLPNAVCCEDHLHCCPQNSHCNLKEKSCDKNGKSVTSWFEKIPSKLIYNKNEPKIANDPILCADNVTTCDPMDTCCKMADGSYGCCPYADGVCCTDLSFCCPGDSFCGKRIGECLKKTSMEQLEFKAGKIEKLKADCEGTVCENQSGQSVCCPYSNGTCCGTHGFCCPKGYNCNPKDESCQMQDPDVSKPILNARKMNLLGAAPNFDTMIECPDSVHYCPDSSTCCKTKDSFGCCAIDNAVCCEDGVNCCPQGYLCATNSTTSCLKKGVERTKLD